MGILLQLRWPVADGALTPEAIAKVGPYIMRYAETLNVRVSAVGGIGDHLHILADIPADMAPERISRELLSPTSRYLRDVLGIRGFAWNAAGISVVSISPWDVGPVVAYIAEQESRHADGELDAFLEGLESAENAAAAPAAEELPSWLTDALSKDKA